MNPYVFKIGIAIFSFFAWRNKTHNISGDTLVGSDAELWEEVARRVGAEASFRKVGSFDDLALKVQKKRKERTLQNEGNHGKEKNSLSGHCSSSSFILWEPLEPSFIGEAQKKWPNTKMQRLVFFPAFCGRWGR